MVTFPPPPVDTDSVRASVAMFSGLMAYHRGEHMEITFSFWGDSYKVTVDDKGMNIQSRRRANEQEHDDNHNRTVKGDRCSYSDSASRTERFSFLYRSHLRCFNSIAGIFNQPRRIK